MAKSTGSTTRLRSVTYERSGQTVERKIGRRDSKVGTIYERPKGSGRYTVRVLIGYDDVSGKPRFCYQACQTHAEAVAVAKTLQDEKDKGKLRATKKDSVREVVDGWLENMIRVNRAPKTYQQYRYIFEAFVFPAFGSKQMSKITQSDVQALAATMLRTAVRSRGRVPSSDESKCLSVRTVKLTVTLLHSAYKFAIKRGFASVNPATDIDLPKPREKSAKFMTKEETQKLISVLEDSPIRELLLFMLVTGTRVSESTGLRWDDVNFSSGTVRITGQLQRLGGKLRRTEGTKSNRDRTIPLPAWLVEELRSVRARQLVEDTLDPDNIVFLNPFGRRVDPKYLWNWLAKHCADAGVPRLNPHGTRHTAATLALMETGDLHAVQKMLGHSQVSLTSDLYGHATLKGTRRITEATGNLFRPKPL
ncbi:site-specific integrase [soil metagenome]